MAPADARQRLIVALDVASWAEAQELVQTLDGLVGFYKVGLELYTAAGPEVVRALVAAGHRVFLDLKLFDVPETVKRATAAAARLGATFLTVHETARTVAAAVEGAGSVPASEPGRGLGILAVTVLTSMDAADLTDQSIRMPVEELVLHRARRARAAGARGVIASPLEVAAIRGEVGPDLAIVTPGIRPAGSAAGDQKRLATPATALASGADYLVVGRPITRAQDPRAAAQAVLDEMASA